MRKTLRNLIRTNNLSLIDRKVKSIVLGMPVHPQKGHQIKGNGTLSFTICRELGKLCARIFVLGNMTSLNCYVLTFHLFIFWRLNNENGNIFQRKFRNKSKAFLVSLINFLLSFNFSGIYKTQRTEHEPHQQKREAERTHCQKKAETLVNASLLPVHDMKRQPKEEIKAKTIETFFIFMKIIILWELLFGCFVLGYGLLECEECQQYGVTEGLRGSLENHQNRHLKIGNVLPSTSAITLHYTEFA